MEYLDSVEAEYQTLYRKNNWLKAVATPELAFVGDNNGNKGGKHAGHS